MRAVLFFILCVTGSVIVNRFISYLSLQKARRELIDMLHEADSGDFGDMSDDLWEDNEDYGESQELTVSTMSWSDKDIYDWLKETYPDKDFMHFDGNVIGTDNFELYCDTFRSDTIGAIVLTYHADVKDTEGKKTLELKDDEAEFYWNDVKTQPVATGDFLALRYLATKLVNKLGKQL